MTVAYQNGGVFAQKALVTIISGLITVLTAFFVWLALAVIEIRERMAKIEVSVTVLAEARARQTADDTATTARRVEQLEKEVKGK